MSYFSVPHTNKNKIEVELDLPNHARKTSVKNATSVDPSQFAKKEDLVYLKSDVDKLDKNKLEKVQSDLKSLKSKVDKLDVDKLKTVPVNLKKLGTLVEELVE